MYKRQKETRGADPNNLYYEPLDPNREGETYKEFYAASWKAAHGDLKGFYPETYLASARRHFAANGKAILKAYRSDGELAGIVETDTERSEGAGVGWISLVYIKEHLRGRGLGTQLVGRAITNYEMLGRQKVRLHVSSENASAIKFYEDLGFEILGSEPGAGAPLYAEQDAQGLCLCLVYHRGRNSETLRLLICKQNALSACFLEPL